MHTPGSFHLEKPQVSFQNIIPIALHIKIMFDPGSYVNPTPLAHADASRDVLPRGVIGGVASSESDEFVFAALSESDEFLVAIFADRRRHVRSVGCASFLSSARVTNKVARKSGGQIMRTLVPLGRNIPLDQNDHFSRETFISFYIDDTATKHIQQRMNASICGTMMAAFVLDAMQVNAAFQSALSNGIVTKHPELWFGVRYRTMNDTICYELRII
ncbi:hypothetical protein TNCV_3321201 [Trichonephila clavipes]|nr:hypothetical protein TNCV_3321201 [Trichonephila clavipes]